MRLGETRLATSTTINTAIPSAINGARSAMTAISTDPINSSWRSRGSNPAVTAELFNRSNDVEAWTTRLYRRHHDAIVYCSQGGYPQQARLP